MHIVVSWDISEGAPTRGDLSEKLVTVLRPYSWFRPLTTYYIVKTDEIGRQAIYAGLLSVGRSHPNRINFVVSPLMQGAYLGFLPEKNWPQINERTA